MPLGLNPHLLPQSEEQTTRSAYDAKENESVSRVPEELYSHLRRLDSLVRQALGDFSLSSQQRTKKRKREHEISKNDGSSTMVSFRLVSSTLPPQAISLIPSCHDAIPHQRPSEDTPAEEQLRRERAQEAAIETDMIITQPHLRGKYCKAPIQTFSPTGDDISPVSLPRLLAIKHDRLILRSARYDDARTTYVKCCPLVDVKDLPSQPINSKKRRRKSAPPRYRPPAQFFRPMEEWGGKSAGYAMGWNNSHPAMQLRPCPYVRDTMRRGVTL